MKRLVVKMTAKELDLLRSLAADQLFRREFIDVRLPGYRSNAAELSMGKTLVERLRITTDRAKGTPAWRRSGQSTTHAL